ncbi:piggyBac transposable element-derived protein 3-like [Myxocyprinus asiaticus]|uniref:piggyBac transposable element-derived protein 3-like n=1 Tax=Myxocyprinus asiaticus TaxID=70543 RepID=UPI002222442E|nr:piggyBac transposable element-derived protein 3-like [Myxocyprinus asiaticus]
MEKKIPYAKMKTQMKMTVCLKITVVFPRPLDGKHVTPLPLQYSLNGYSSLHQPINFCLHTNISKVFSPTTSLSLLLMSQTCTILYIQCNPAKLLNLTVQELEQFFGTVLHMSLFGLPATCMFWSQSSRIAHVADVMPLARWEAIHRFLHFSDNSCQPTRDMADYDELFKIRPLLNHIFTKLKQLPMRETLSVDEQMVPFKGKSRIKLYLPSKPRKWGYKILVLAGSDGVPHNFEVYTGKAVHLPELPDIGASGNVVLHLAEPVLKNRNFKLFFDNWFSSVPLMLVMSQQGIHCLGTMRSNRLPGSSMMLDTDLKRSVRGSFQEKMAYV